MQLLFLFVVISIYLNAQNDLQFYCDVMANAYEGKNRMFAAKEFEKTFISTLKEQGSFQNEFTELKWISIKTDEAKTFKIFTWQVRDENNKYHNFGLIQKHNDEVITLMDTNDPNPDNEYETNEASHWMGGLYYKIMEQSIDNKKIYLLFGYDANDGKLARKFCDVLSFDEQGIPLFGKEIFKISDGVRPDLKSRIVLEYSLIANVNFNYNDQMGMIVHDYIVSRLGVSEDGSIAKIPDGTYVGYKWDGKYWNFIEKIQHQISDEADIYYKPKPKESVKRDIMGKKID